MRSPSCSFQPLIHTALLAAILFVPPVPAQTAKIERIDIRGNRRCSEDAIRSYIQSRAGGLYDETRLNLDLRAIHATGDFELVQISEREGSYGKIVTFTVVKRPLLRSLEFVGFEPSELSAMKTYFKEHKIDISVDSFFDPAKVRAVQRALEKMLAQQGRNPGKVRSEIEQIPPASVRVKFIRVK